MSDNKTTAADPWVKVRLTKDHVIDGKEHKKGTVVALPQDQVEFLMGLPKEAGGPGCEVLPAETKSAVVKK